MVCVPGMGAGRGQRVTLEGGASFTEAGGATGVVWSPNAWESLVAASITTGTSARGRGGRMRMDGALMNSAATTWPEASRTGAQTLTAPATTSSEVIR